MLEWYLGILIHILSADEPDKTFPEVFRHRSAIVTFFDSPRKFKRLIKGFLLSFLIIFIECTHDLGWHTNGDGIGWNIVSNYRSQTDNTIITYCYVLQYPYVTGKPYIVTNRNMSIAWQVIIVF